MKDTFEILSQYFLDLHTKKTSTLPPREQILYAVDIAIRDPSHENSKYVNLMYHAMKDLFRLDHHIYHETTYVDEGDKQITTAVYRIYPNKVGRQADPPITWTPPHFDELYSGKTPSELNSGTKAIFVSKIEALYSSPGTVNPENYINNQDIQENIEEDFKLILNSRILPCDFEYFIEFLGGDSLFIQEEGVTEIEAPTLESLFSSTEEFEQCIHFLKLTTPPVLTSTNILNPDLGTNNRKNAVAAWFSVLIDKGRVRAPNNNKTRADILNRYFKGLDISSSRVTPRATETNYKREEYLNEFKLVIK